MSENPGASNFKRPQREGFPFVHTANNTFIYLSNYACLLLLNCFFLKIHSDFFDLVQCINPESRVVKALGNDA